MNKFGMVLGLAAVATLAGCKDPDYNRAPASGTQNAPVNVETDTQTTSIAVATTVQPTKPKCTCPPGTRHSSPCACGDADCMCIVETKSVAAPVVAPAQSEYTVYIVQSGDYLAKISKKFNVTINSIKRLNPSIKNDIVRVGQKLKLPGKVDVGVQVAPKASSAAAKPASGKRAASSGAYIGATKEYVVKNGDTLGSIAYGNGINIRQLKALNGLSSDSLKIGQKLKIPAQKVVKAPKAAAASDKTAASKAGEKAVVADSKATAGAVAAQTAAGEIKKDAVEEPKTAADEAKPATGDVPVADAVSAEKPTPAKAAPATTTYVVQEGDDMTGVSIRWGVSAAEIRELNNMAEGDQLTPGKAIKLPADAQQ